MSADIEQLLREAMHEAARQAVDDGRPVPPLREPDHATAWRPGRPDRGHWFLPLAATAAVLALLAGGAVAVAVVSENRDGTPATGVTTAPATTSESAPRTAQPELVLDVGVAPQSPLAGEQVQFTVRGTGTTAETDGAIDYPVVSFGDGTADAVPASIDPACSGAPAPIDDTFTVPHTYAEPGSYQVTVTIGSCGLTRTQTLTVEVAAG